MSCIFCASDDFAYYMHIICIFFGIFLNCIFRHTFWIFLHIMHIYCAYFVHFKYALYIFTANLQHVLHASVCDALCILKKFITHFFCRFCLLIIKMQNLYALDSMAALQGHHIHCILEACILMNIIIKWWCVFPLLVTVGAYQCILVHLNAYLCV
jgi:hypothetical protein